MDLHRVAPDLRRPVRRLPPMLLHRSWYRSLVRWAQRRLTRVDVGSGVTVEEVTVDQVTVEQVSAGPVHVRLYRPADKSAGATPRPGLFWIHGGGLVIGAPAMDDQLCAGFVRDSGVTVASVSYRLAPEHRFPAALDDVATGWSWFAGAAASLGVDPERIVVGGQSAGGGLAAALAHRLHDDAGAAVQPCAQLLLCPMLDDRTAARTDLDRIRHRVWNNRQNRYGWGAYLGSAPGSANTPRYAVSARRQSLAGLPPAWIGVGDIDLFHDEDLTYARRLAEEGVEVTTVVVPGAPHGFESWASETGTARQYLAAAQQWLRTVTSPTGPAGS